MSLTIPLIAMIVGTFALRLIGPALRSRMTISPRIDTVMNTAVAVIFVALIATSTLLVGKDFAGFAAPIGVTVAGILAWRKAPFVVIVIAAAATTAALRWIGVA
ncbi:AzlD domain-containing protein [Rhodococcus fascians]|uniref:AzlD domain-containing protein n=1 Tax=Rhodococcoides fascians TaxID=1828 RepID=UPI00195959D0|nr:AzlD domain-containing protein [Rhodococcus fascians]MBM7243061.1 AzlD domain-containing protein [Rhodococcus fascians]MBY3808843.1 AzlD domain-containing protein [Rhodococcus fascians]MBY3841209.1 AzlD domain-containing protein [Rhodococcus fascians]MBY3847401.1 AzlD domain-containing protein [Rhodococcus fascians]MBY3852697.1 AzlD domain-containing protein [Rhodococcus fascians]